VIHIMPWHVSCCSGEVHCRLLYCVSIRYLITSSTAHSSTVRASSSQGVLLRVVFNVCDQYGDQLLRESLDAAMQQACTHAELELDAVSTPRVDGVVRQVAPVAQRRRDHLAVVERRLDDVVSGVVVGPTLRQHHRPPSPQHNIAPVETGSYSSRLLTDEKIPHSRSHRPDHLANCYKQPTSLIQYDLSYNCHL